MITRAGSDDEDEEEDDDLFGGGGGKKKGGKGKAGGGCAARREGAAFPLDVSGVVRMRCRFFCAVFFICAVQLCP